MNQRMILIVSGVFGTLAVALGAFGAHALKGILQSHGRQDTFELSVRYQFYHTFAILCIGILAEKFPSIKRSALLFSLGIIIFCGSLYILSLTNQTGWGAVTPVGGLAFIAGWINFIWGVIKKPHY